MNKQISIVNPDNHLVDQGLLKAAMAEAAIFLAKDPFVSASIKISPKNKGGELIYWVQINEAKGDAIFYSSRRYRLRILRWFVRHVYVSYDTVHLNNWSLI